MCCCRIWGTALQFFFYCSQWHVLGDVTLPWDLICEPNYSISTPFCRLAQAGLGYSVIVSVNNSLLLHDKEFTLSKAIWCEFSPLRLGTERNESFSLYFLFVAKCIAVNFVPSGDANLKRRHQPYIFGKCFEKFVEVRAPAHGFRRLPL